MLESIKRNKAWTQQQWEGKLNEAKITSHVMKGIQEIDESELATFPLQLALLDNDLEELVSYS
jgi:hypothetical protein